MTASLTQYQTVTTMKARTQGVPIHAGTMITALVTENAPFGAGAMVAPSAMAHQCRSRVRLTNHKIIGGPTVAGKIWSAPARELAQPGAGAMEPPIAEP